MGAAVALVLTAFVTTPAQAGVGVSEWCSQGWLGGTDGHYRELSNNNTTGYLAVNWGTPDTTDWSINVCYSDRALGSPSFAWGGMVHLGFTTPAPNTYHIYTHCYGEPGMAGTFNCQHNSYTTITTHTTPGVGMSIATLLDIAGSTLGIGTTGADSGSPSLTNPTTTPTAQLGGTCATVAGITPPTGTSCSTDAVDAQVATTDAPNVRTGGTTSTCLVLVGSTCHLYAPRAFVEAFDDGANDTYAKLLGLGPSDPGRVCIGFGC
jgi:hypothetical protein